MTSPRHHWLVYCADGLRRHDWPFESRGEALHWQTWGHYPCPFQPHTLRKIPLSFPVLPGEADDGKNGVDAGSRSCSSADPASTPYIEFRELIPRLREVDWSPQVGAGNPFGEVRGQPFLEGTGR